MTPNRSLLLNLFTPLRHTWQTYNGRKLRGDLIAGLTVSVVEIPQAMAYALIAGVPPEYGIYTSILQGIIGALLSSSEHLTTGPTNTQSLLIAAAVQRLAGDPSNPIYLELVFALTVLKGLIQFAFAIARMGNLIRYVSRSVILAVASGAGVLIIVGQLPHLLGKSIHGLTSPYPGILGTLHRLLQSGDAINTRAALLCLTSVAGVLTCRAISRFIPGALIAVVAGAYLAWHWGWSSDTLQRIGAIPAGFPHFHIPNVTVMHAEDLLPGALALALLGLIESVAIVKSIASKSGERIDPNQEFLAQGLKNMATGFFQCMPGSGSFTRSALDYEAGGQTRFAAVFNALFVLIIYLCFARAAAYIPLASLSAVLIAIAIGLIEWRYFGRLLRTSREESVVFTITFLAVILIPLEYAVFIGIFLNLALYLRQASRLHMAEMVQSPSGTPGNPGVYVERPLEDATSREVLFLQMEGDLFFAVADELQERLDAIARGPTKAVIFRLKRTHSIDATVLHVLEQFSQGMRAKGGHVLLCGVRPELHHAIRQFGLEKIIGSENVFPSAPGIFTSAKQAMQRAEMLLGRALDATRVADLQAREAAHYEI